MDYFTQLFNRMDYFTRLFNGFLQDQQVSQWIVLGSVFVGFLILAFAIAALFEDFFSPVRSRFKTVANKATVLSGSELGLTEQLHKHHILFMPMSNELLQRTTTRLHYAGFHSNTSLLTYYGLKWSLSIGLPIIVIVVLRFFAGMNALDYFRGVLIAIGVGYLGPSFVLDRLIASRQKTLERSFPDALDMIVVCCEIGLSLDAAIQKVSSEFVINHPELAAELNMVIAETRVGIDRMEALKRIVERTGVESLNGLVSTLVQSMRYGTSISDALRLYADDFRDKRAQSAEETAAQIGVKLIFPLGVLLLPAFLLVLLAPTIIYFQNMYR